MSELIEAAAAGEPVCITRRGKPSARRIAPAALQTITDAMPVQPPSAHDLARRMLDGERY
ncbi:MAG TPA: type II toxin-antitoxin system prevent-host-death family antitoxin [Stellaceae bacterium]